MYLANIVYFSVVCVCLYIVHYIHKHLSEVHMRVQDIFGCVIIFLAFFICFSTISVVEYLREQMNELKFKKDDSCASGILKGNFQDCVGDTANIKFGEMALPMQQDYNRVLREYIDNTKKSLEVENRFKMSLDYNMGRFLNLNGKMYIIVTQIQIMIAKLFDSFNRIYGTITSLFNLLEVGRITATAVVDGPVGDVVRQLAEWGFCFHPNTEIPLYSGNTKKIKDMCIGDVLENGSRVMGTIDVKGNAEDDLNTNPYYSIYSKRLGGKIYVTGSHKMRVHGLSKQDYDITCVKEHPHAKLEKDIRTNTFKCLITDDHLIQIGEHTFYDWEY
mgnify:CR=1 FL=1